MKWCCLAITVKRLWLQIWLQQAVQIFFYDNVMKHFTYIKSPFLNSQYGNSQIMFQKNTYKGGLREGGLRDLPNMPKLWISLKPLALAQNSNNIKKIRPKHMSRFYNSLLSGASVTNSEFVSTFSGRQCELLWKI